HSHTYTHTHTHTLTYTHTYSDLDKHRHLQQKAWKNTVQHGIDSKHARCQNKQRNKHKEQHTETRSRIDSVFRRYLGYEGVIPTGVCGGAHRPHTHTHTHTHTRTRTHSPSVDTRRTC